MNTQNDKQQQENPVQVMDVNSDPRTVLAIQGLRVAFAGINGESATVVDDISFSLQKQKTMALVGESGSGKSVTAMSILQLHEARKVRYQGRIIYQGQNLLRMPEAEIRRIRGNRIAMIFQEPMTSLNPVFSVGSQIMEPLILHQGLARQQAKKRAIELMDLTGIKEPQKRFAAYPHMLSGGQRQRVMIAMALACKPDVLIADEPTTALDVTVQLKILQLLQALKKELSMAVLLITHNLNLVKYFADDVAVMRKGRIVERQTVEQLFAGAQHPYTQELINSTPQRLITPEETQALQDKPVLLQGMQIKCYFPLNKSWLARKRSYIKAVDQVDIRLRDGETLGIVGESGSGKSTLGRCLLRLQSCEGHIEFNQTRLDGLKFNQLRPLRKDFQMVFQDPFSSLSPRMTIAQIIAEGLQIHYPRLSTSQRQQKIIKVLQEVGLDESALWRYPHEFSGGQRQRIAIARVVVLEPKLILLDEPTSALDVSIQKQVLDLLRNLQTEYHMSYLFISHDLKVIEAISHYMLVMQNGRVVEAGETEQLFRQPQHPYTRALLSASLFRRN